VHHGPLFLSYGPPIHCPSATATCGTLPVVPFRAPGFASFTWLQRLFSAFPNARIWCSLPSYPRFPSPLVADLFHVPSSSSSLIWVSFCFSLFLVCLGLMEFAVEFFFAALPIARINGGKIAMFFSSKNLITNTFLWWD
jgi:hypothetical protein